MSSSSHPVASSNNPYLAAFLSLLIPGAGQVYLRKFVRGVAILVVALVLAFLIYWGQDNFKIGQIQIGDSLTSWIWGLLALYALWNIFDAYRLARGEPSFSGVGFLIPTIAIYLIAWQSTDVNLNRLVERFSDAQIVFRALAQPDLFARDKVEENGRVAFWVPCSDPPQPLPPPGSYGIALDKSCGNIGEPVTIRGGGFTPNVVGRIYLVESAGGTNEIQLREENKAVEVPVGPDGRIEKTFLLPRTVAEPRFAGPTGIDPNNPLEYGFEVRFSYEVGTPHPSENFNDIIGKIEDKPAPDWMVSLGIVTKDQAIPTLVPGDMLETIALGLMATIFSTILAFPISFFAAHNVLARVPGGSIIYYLMRMFLNVVRAIDTIIWGLIVIVWVGLGSFAGLIALTIHSVAALGKLFSEEIEHIDPGPVEAVTATGANLIQTIRYAIVPQIIPSFLSYTLLRWDINMRSATVVGFVAGGGIGYFVLEAIRKGAYAQYAAALYAVAIVIIAVDFISAKMRERILIGETKVSLESPKPFYRSPRAIMTLFISAIIFVYFWDVVQIDLRKLFEPAPTFVKLVTDYLTIDTTPAVVNSALKQMIITIFQALIATTLGGLIAIPFSFLAARNLTGRSVLSIWIYYATRSLFNILRSIEALLYVAIFVFWVGIGPFAGSLALAVTTFALIGKLFSEAIENIDPGPLEAITSTGATRLQAIVYGIIPQIVPPFISYLIYQWDINVRISTIIGFAGGGGVGLLFVSYANLLQYHKAGTVIAMIVIVVTLMDFASAKIRERMV